MRPPTGSRRRLDLTSRARMVALAVVVVPAMALTSAQAATRDTVIDVFPGPNALTTALANATSGDTLRIHTGTYDEAVTVTTPSLQLVSAGDGPITIDGGCSTRA